MNKTSEKAVKISGCLFAIALGLSILSNIFNELWLISFFSSASFTFDFVLILRNIIYDILDCIPAVLMLLYVFCFYKKGKMYILIPIFFIYNAVSIAISIVSNLSSLSNLAQDPSYYIGLYTLITYFYNFIYFAGLVFIIIISFRRFEAKWHKIFLSVFYSIHAAYAVFSAFDTVNGILNGAYGSIPTSTYSSIAMMGITGAGSALVISAAMIVLVWFANFNGTADVPEEYSPDDKLRVLKIQFESGEINEKEYLERCEQINKTNIK